MKTTSHQMMKWKLRPFSAITIFLSLWTSQVLGATSVSCNQVHKFTPLTKRQKAAMETADVLARISSESKTLTIANKIIGKSISNSPSEFKFTSEWADLDTVKMNAGFIRKNSRHTVLEHEPTIPLTYSINQIRVTPHLDLIIKPNVTSNVRSGYGMIPLAAKLSPDGKIKNVHPLFASQNHPLREFDSRDYDYSIDVNLQTSVSRAVFTIREKHSSFDYLKVPMGQADVFFARPGDREFPSLSQATGYKFNHVVALSETIYVGETTEGQIIFMDYSPLQSSAQILYRSGGTPEDHLYLASTFRKQVNRDRASAQWRGKQLFIETQTDTFHLTPADSSSYGSLTALPTNHRPEKDKRPTDPDFGQSFHHVKVVNTAPNPPKEFLRLGLVQHVESAGPGRPERRFNQISRYDSADRVVQKWQVQGDDLSPTFFRVKGGFIVQRMGYNTRSTINEIGAGQGHDRRLIFLSDDGSHEYLSDVASKEMGDVTVVNDHVFVISPQGKYLNIWNLAE